MKVCVKEIPFKEIKVSEMEVAPSDCEYVVDGDSQVVRVVKEVSFK